MKIDIKKLKGDISSRGLIYILGVIGILFILLSSFSDGEKKELVTEEVDYCSMLESKLEEILPQIASVGKVKVMITAKNHGEIILAKDETENNKNTVVLNQKGGGEDAKIVEEIYPEIQGVIIAADGGKSDRVKMSITEAVTALLGVDAHKIKVFERETNNGI